MTENELKPCSRCEILKHKFDFYRNKSNKDGLTYICKSCSKDYYQENKENINNRSKKYHKENREKIAKAMKAYRSLDSVKKARRISNKNSRERYPNSLKSRNYFARNRSSLKNKSRCESCLLDTTTEAHHCDYNKPMDVIYLCKACHVDWHMNNTPLNREYGIFTEAKNED